MVHGAAVTREEFEELKSLLASQQQTIDEMSKVQQMQNLLMQREIETLKERVLALFTDVIGLCSDLNRRASCIDALARSE